MDFDNIKKSAKLMKEFGLTEFSYEKEGIENFTLKKEFFNEQVPINNPVLQVKQQSPPPNTQNSFLSPLVGVFYPSPNPKSPTFIEKGQKVKKGDILCIIESMKVMNEIHADFNGKIIEILIEDGESVEYNQAIFKYK